MEQMPKPREVAGMNHPGPIHFAHQGGRDFKDNVRDIEDREKSIVIIADETKVPF